MSSRQYASAVRPVAAGLLMLLLPVASAVAEPGIEPTAEEVLMLEYVNRARADPAAEAERIGAYGRVQTHSYFRQVDWDLFEQEVRALSPAPPLVMERRLVLAARRHAAYMVVNLAFSHLETPGRPGFTGRESWDRAARAGYPGARTTESIGEIYGDLWADHVEFVVDWTIGGGGIGGMQDDRPHRMKLFGARGDVDAEFGFGRVPGEKRGFTCALFVPKGEKVYVGGVAYADEDGDAFYDIGEGLGGVTISIDGAATTRTWASGGYTLTRRHAKAARITASWNGMHLTRGLPASEDNVKFDAVFPTRAWCEQIDALLADLHEARASGKASAILAAALVLHMEAQRQALDDERARLVDAETEDAAERVLRAYEVVRSALRGPDRREALQEVRAAGRPFLKTVVGPWFQDAIDVVPVQFAVSHLLTRIAEGHSVRRASREGVRRRLAKVQGGLRTREWRDHVAALYRALDDS